MRLMFQLCFALQLSYIITITIIIISSIDLYCSALLPIIFMIASNAFEADNSSHQLIHSNNFSISMLLPAFKVRGFPALSHLSCDLLPGLDWLFNWKSISLWFSIGCQVISNFHFILNDQHRHLHHRANQKCNFSNHLRKAPFFSWIFWSDYLVLIGSFVKSTWFHLVYLKRHLVLLGLFEESTLFYLVYLTKAPCVTWFIWRKHLLLLGLFEKAPCFTWIPLQLDFSLTQVALVRRLEVEDFNWDSQKWIFFATFGLLSINRQFWGSDNLPRSRESH